MSSGIRVGQVGPEEWRTWRAARLRALRTDPGAFGGTADVEAGYPEALERSRLDGTAGPALLARGGHEVVGTGAGWVSAPGELTVVSMWTDPAWRGRGVGGAVLGRVVTWARSRDLRVVLWVADGNPAARRWYERHGSAADGATAPLRPGATGTRRRLGLLSAPV